MADALYDKFKEQILQGGIDLLTADIRLAVIDATDYTFAATHEFLSSVPAAAREEAMAAGMTGKSVTDGKFDAADVVLTGTSGDAVDAFIVYVHTGVDATARLIAYIDSYSAFPITLGVDITFQWHADGIFQV
jgi:hypothetical protein